MTMSPLRILAIVLGAIAVLLVALVVWFSLLFDANEYRERLAALAREHTGRELRIGDIGITLFPWLGAKAEALELGNAPGFGEEPFARVGQASARVRLLPLLSGRVELDRVELAQLDLNLERDKQGRGNWEDLGARGGQPQAGDKTPEGDAPGAAAAFVVAGIDLVDARVRWADRQAGTQYTLDKLRFETGRIEPGEPFPLETEFDFAAAEARGHLQLTATVSADPAAQRYRFADLKLRTSANGAGVPGGKVDLELDSDIDADLAADTLAVRGTRLEAWGVEAALELAGSKLRETPQLAGSLKLQPFSPRELLQALGKPLQTADAGVLGKASLNAAVQASANGVALDKLLVQLDDSKLQGSLAVTDFARKALRFDLALDTIDLDRYLPPPADAKDKPAVATPGAAAAAAEPGALRTLAMQGRLRIGALKASGMRLADIVVNARAADGVLRLQPVASLYGGRYSGNIAVDARGKAQRLSLDETLSGIQIGPLLRDFGGKEERLTGRADLKARLDASGDDAAAMKRTLSGTASFNVRDGALKGVNIAQLLREASARLKGETPPASNAPAQTDFAELSGSVRIAEGVARNDDLLARSPLLRVSGSGTADLPRERIDYRIRASVVGTLEGQGGRDLEALRGVTVPIRVSGSFDAPSYALDVETLLKEQVRGKVEEKLKERLDERLKEGLRGLFR